MSIEYKVTQNGQRIEAFPKGELDITKTIDYFGRLKNDMRIKQNAVEIVSFKNVTEFKISNSESEKIAESYQDLKATQMIDKTIFICETTLSYGIGRMLQAFHEFANSQHKVVVIKSEEELEEVIKKL